MPKITTTYPADDDIKIMLPEQFDEAVAKTKIKRADLLNAARLVMVDNASVVEAAKRYAIEDKYLYRAIASVQKMWDQICQKKGWVTDSASLPPELWQVLVAVQSTYAKELKEQREAPKASRRKKPRND